MVVSKDVVSGIIILVACATLYYVTTTFDTDPLGAAQGMPATHMPRLILATIAGLTIIMIVQGLRVGSEEREAPPPWRMWATAAVLGAAAILFEPIGVPITFLAVCVVLPLMWGSRNYLAILIFAVCVPVAIYVVFRMALGLRMPMGPIAAFGF